jgi:alkylation response protein AidB-like acyl-CoA dehydrogenase
MDKMQTKVKGAEFLFSQIEAEAIFTPEDFTDEHKMIASTTKQFIEGKVHPNHEAIEEQDFDIVVSLLRQAGELGLLSHSVPENYGGLGLDKISKGIVGEIVGQTGSYGVAHSNHTCIATLPITYFGTEEQKAKYLPKLASGEYLGAYCLTEASAGSDALNSKTTAVLNEEGTHYILNGSKQFITNAVFSDTFIVYAKVDGEKFTAFIVEKDYPGLSLGPEEKKMGIKGSSTRPVILEDCKVPVENLLGEIGKGHVIALNVLNLGRFNLGSACMGGAKSALELAVNYTNQRTQFGKSLSTFKATQEKLANMAARIYAAESVQYRTAQLLENALGGLYEETNHRVIANQLMEYAVECAVCKVFGSETLDEVADEALQLHGGYGFIKEYRIEQVYRDSRINRIFEGTNEINRLLIPGFLLKKAARGEIALQEIIQQAYQEMIQGTPQLEGPLAREREIIQSIRRVFLVLAGQAFLKFGMKLDDEQETLMKLADIAILLYAAESAVLRSVKAVEQYGLQKEELKVSLTTVFVDDTLLKVELLARQLLGGIGSSSEESASLVQKELGKYVIEGTFGRKREIASRLIEVEKYTC